MNYRVEKVAIRLKKALYNILQPLSLGESLKYTPPSSDT